MRGKDAEAAIDELSRRITPAHAGKSPMLITSRYITQDHPRPCGEKYVDIVQKAEDIGSPPPMRGKDNALLGLSFTAGITPAHAGKSPSTSFWRAASRDHPRPCGEKLPLA